MEWYARKELAAVLSRQGRFDEASQQFAGIFSEQKHGPDAPDGAAIEILIDRAAHRGRMLDYENAIADARLARDLAADRLPDGNWAIALADAEMARAQFEQARTAEPASLLHEAADRLRTTFDPDDARVRELDALIVQSDNHIADQ